VDLRGKLMLRLWPILLLLLLLRLQVPTARCRA